MSDTPYLDELDSGPHVALDTRGKLPAARIDTEGLLGDAAADPAEANVVAILVGEDAFGVTPLTSLLRATNVGAGTGAPTGSLTAGALTRDIAATETPDWTTLCELLMTGAGGLVSVAATARISAVIGAGLASTDRVVRLRLVIDGTTHGEVSRSLSSDSTSGTANVYTWATTTWALPLGLGTHRVRIEWVAGLGPIDLYSTGSTITVTDAGGIGSGGGGGGGGGGSLGILVTADGTPIATSGGSLIIEVTP